MRSRNRIPFGFHCFPRSRGVRSWWPWKKAAGRRAGGRPLQLQAAELCVSGCPPGWHRGLQQPHALHTALHTGCGHAVAGSPAEAAGHAGSPCTPRPGGLVRAPLPPRSPPGLPPCACPGVSCLPPACRARLALHLHPPPPSPPPHFIPVPSLHAPASSLVFSLASSCSAVSFFDLMLTFHFPLRIPTWAYQHSLLFRSQESPGTPVCHV